MTDDRRKVLWHDSYIHDWTGCTAAFAWLYGQERNELLLHHMANAHVAPETQEQLDRVTHWAVGPNPHEDEIYLPYPPDSNDETVELVGKKINGG